MKKRLQPVLTATPAEDDTPEAALPVLSATEAEAVDILARTLWGEARGEPLRGIEAVAAVVLNRVHQARTQGRSWWGHTITEVCLRPWQFSCWNAKDPNRQKLLAVTATDPAFATCLRVARRAVRGTLADPTDGATHYHTRSCFPPWAAGRIPCADIGQHLFYNAVE